MAEPSAKRVARSAKLAVSTALGEIALAKLAARKVVRVTRRVPFPESSLGKVAAWRDPVCRDSWDPAAALSPREGTFAELAVLTVTAGARSANLPHAESRATQTEDSRRAIMGCSSEPRAPPPSPLCCCP